jgi:hypothetical protein
LRYLYKYDFLHHKGGTSYFETNRTFYCIMFILTTFWKESLKRKNPKNMSFVLINTFLKRCNQNVCTTLSWLSSQVRFTLGVRANVQPKSSIPICVKVEINPKGFTLIIKVDIEKKNRSTLNYWWMLNIMALYWPQG